MAEVVSTVKFTETEIDNGVRWEGKHVQYFLIPVSRKTNFWKSELWKDIQALNGEVFFY